ncbi:Hypothetical_protein [Hexamita inflata]|uniref:Hypothetical_protein n=1 Tax=Hexamita inflata TaxID=28002 RepID=A0AA86PM53_9EUKA|nr:Hypothetical protein HINF_LOCUS29646 [Hexamita inflata]
MDSSNSQYLYLSLYTKFINSKPDIYGLQFRSKQSDALHQPAPKVCETSNTNTEPVFSCKIPAIYYKSHLEQDTDCDLSAITFQQTNETICEKQNNTQINQNELNLLINALQINGMRANLSVVNSLNKPVHVVQHQIKLLFSQIEDTVVSNQDWAELSLKINPLELTTVCLYRCIKEDKVRIIRSFKAAFKVTQNQVFSVQYCCKKFGVETKLVNTLVRQACVL